MPRGAASGGKPNLKALEEEETSVSDTTAETGAAEGVGDEVGEWEGMGAPVAAVADEGGGSSGQEKRDVMKAAGNRVLRRWRRKRQA